MHGGHANSQPHFSFSFVADFAGELQNLPGRPRSLESQKKKEEEETRSENARRKIDAKDPDRPERGLSTLGKSVRFW